MTTLINMPGKYFHMFIKLRVRKLNVFYGGFLDIHVCTCFLPSVQCWKLIAEVSITCTIYECLAFALPLFPILNILYIKQAYVEYLSLFNKICRVFYYLCHLKQVWRDAVALLATRNLVAASQLRLHLVSHGELVFHILPRFLKNNLDTVHLLGRQVQVWERYTNVCILSSTSIASFSMFASWQFPHGYLQNVLTDEIPAVFSLVAMSE